MTIGLGSCYRACNYKTPDMYPGSDGGDGVFERRAYWSVAGTLGGIAALTVAAYLRGRVKKANGNNQV